MIKDEFGAESSRKGGKSSTMERQVKMDMGQVGVAEADIEDKKKWRQTLSDAKYHIQIDR